MRHSLLQPVTKEQAVSVSVSVRHAVSMRHVELGHIVELEVDESVVEDEDEVNEAEVGRG